MHPGPIYEQCIVESWTDFQGSFELGLAWRFTRIGLKWSLESWSGMDLGQVALATSGIAQQGSSKISQGCTGSRKGTGKRTRQWALGFLSCAVLQGCGPPRWSHQMVHKTLGNAPLAARSLVECLPNCKNDKIQRVGLESARDLSSAHWEFVHLDWALSLHVVMVSRIVGNGALGFFGAKAERDSTLSGRRSLGLAHSRRTVDYCLVYPPQGHFAQGLPKIARRKEIATGSRGSHSSQYEIFAVKLICDLRHIKL